MAVLGAQLVITLIMASIIQKVNPHYSFTKWLLCSTGLYRYLHPPDDVLRIKAGVPKEKPTKHKYKHLQNGTAGAAGNGNGGGAMNTPANQFHIPRNIEVELETLPIMDGDVIYLRYFPECQWLIDFSVYTAIVYIISEIYHYYFPIVNEINLSMVWCLLVIFFALKLLSSLTIMYFQTDESIGERSLVIVACFAYLLIAMIVLVIDESILETGLEVAYDSFNSSATKFLSQQGLQSSGPASKIVVKFFIALACGLLGSLFTFPGLRMAKMHWDSLKYCSSNKMLQLLLNMSFILPLILVVLWIRPISRDYLTVRIFNGMEQPLLKPHIFETLRLLLVVIVVILRFALMPIYLQSYLNIAYERIVELRKEAGRITNIDFQKKISSIFYYLCVVIVQFAAPLILCLYITFMYKSLGGYSWMGMQTETELPSGESAAIETTTSAFCMDDSECDVPDEPFPDNFNIMESAQNIQASLFDLKNLFTTEVYKGFLGFATWWSYFTLFTTSFLGIAYQTYFNKS